MGDYWTNAVRHPEDVGVGCIRRTVNFDSPGLATGVLPIGALEAGCIPLLAHATVVTAFNAGTTNVLTLGTLAVPDGFIAAAGITEATPALYPNLVGTLSGVPLEVNTVIYAKFTQTGTAATTGKAVLMLTFVNKREQDGIPFPAN